INELGQKLERQLNRHTAKPIARRANAGLKDQPQTDEADA
ncbi:MAG: ribosome hibernation-promoting factor, HPF/YfiA family, partial [Aeromonas sobria]